MSIKRYRKSDYTMDIQKRPNILTLITQIPRYLSV